ncbi:SAVED domain-containing protein [Streptomyces sp. SID1121]|uniref:SAVED domain-containing protein n=1 Tax=Streptomyces sp. SID1121 TaxID=3425888 RepID=UPI0040562930
MTIDRLNQLAEYWQIKASVDATSPLTEGWLFGHVKGKLSLLQRLYRSWVMLNKRDGKYSKIILATTKAIDPADIVLAPRATMDARIVETLRNGVGHLADARKRWADHLGVDEAELLHFLEYFHIRHAQSESEWREKVRDAAVGARVRADDPAVTVGVQQVRDWVKAPRQLFTPVQLAATIDELHLRAATARPLVVAQALELDPRAATATYSVDWTHLFEGNDPRNRRNFREPDTARQQIFADLALARQRLRASGILDFEVTGPMRLPLWFTIGTQFSSTAGFTVSAQARDGLWSSDAHPSEQRDLEVFLPESVESTVGRPWAVSVSLATDIAEDVDDYLTAAQLDVSHLRARLPIPGRSALSGLPHARAVIYQLRDELRALRRRLRPPEVHLFIAMPAACALLLGNAWDRMPPTWTYWDLGEPGRYAPALRAEN